MKGGVDSKIIQGYTVHSLRTQNAIIFLVEKKEVDMGAFGDYITKKRTKLGISLRGLAKELDISPSYMSDIEKGNREPNEKSLLDGLVRALQLNQKEANELFDLAASQKNELAKDVSSYVAENNFAKVALRTAKELNATNDDWKKFIKTLKEKK